MQHLRPTSNYAKAFTLLEMMVVLLIIALILGSVAVMVQGIEGNAQGVATASKIKSLETGLTSYKIGSGRYPTQAQGLDALVTRPTIDPKPGHWSQVAKADGIIDAWGHKFIYRNPGKRNNGGYDVFSMGPDGLENTEDDIGNW
jgi:general secretion pathway protein G